MLNINKTLKRRLLVWLLVPLLFLSAAHLYSVYLDTQKTSTELFDKMLVTLALSISEYAISTEGDMLTVDLLELIRQTTNDKLYYRVLGPNGSYLVGYESLPEPEGGLKQINNHIELYDAVYLEQPVRVIAVSMFSDHGYIKGWTKTFVAQTVKDRNAYVASHLLDNSYRVVILLVIVTLMLSTGIHISLKPLKQLQKALDHRDIHDLSPLHTATMPEEIKNLANSINQLFQRLTHQIKLTKRFIENAAHQLRTPITALKLQSDMAARRFKNEGASQDIEKIKHNADRIAHLAHQLLHLSYVEAAAFDHEQFTPVNLASIAQSSITQFTQSHPKAANIVADLTPTWIYANETLITELLTNLLENAEKYAESSQAIKVASYPQENHAVLQVIDQGPGIAPELRELVTERFFRASSDTDGTGLGLAIVKEITLVSKGSMHIRSGENGQGTCIHCQFPLIKSH